MIGYIGAVIMIAAVVVPASVIIIGKIMLREKKYD